MPRRFCLCREASWQIHYQLGAWTAALLSQWSVPTAGCSSRGVMHAAGTQTLQMGARARSLHHLDSRFRGQLDSNRVWDAATVQVLARLLFKVGDPCDGIRVARDLVALDVEPGTLDRLTCRSHDPLRSLRSAPFPFPDVEEHRTNAQESHPLAPEKPRYQLSDINRRAMLLLNMPGATIFCSQDSNVSAGTGMRPIYYWHWLPRRSWNDICCHMSCILTKLQSRFSNCAYGLWWWLRVGHAL